MSACEKEPLLKRRQAGLLTLRSLAISSLSLMCISLFAAQSLWRDHHLSREIPNGYTGELLQIKTPARKAILYEDWRGLSQEEEDTFTFVHTWSGELPVGEREEQEIDPKALRIDFVEGESGSKEPPPKGIQGPAGAPSSGASDGSPGILKEINSKLEKRFNSMLVGETWSESSASALLSQFEDLCGSGLLETASPVSCDLSRAQKWTLVSEPLGDDVLIEGDSVSVSRAGNPRVPILSKPPHSFCRNRHNLVGECVKVIVRAG
jgi:hypothetical protein